jgi:hypothetical protein
MPYYRHISILLPIFFFVSGAVSFNSVLNSKNKPHYFVNRYIALITSFLVFSFPFLLLILIENDFTDYGVIYWLLAWPSGGSYPFDMRQLWFINALILMFFISYPIFKLSRKSLKPLVVVFFASLIYIPLAGQQNLINSCKQVNILRQLDLPMQVHQVFSLINYYFFGALFYQIAILQKKHLIILCLIIFLVSLLLHTQIESLSNMKVFFFEGNTYFPALSYVTTFILLIYRNQMINLLDRLVFFDRLFMSLSKNSYALFLIHTSIIFIFEKYLNLDNLSSQPLSAVVKMMGIIVVSVLLAPCLTTINSKLVNLVKIQKTSKENQENILNAD